MKQLTKLFQERRAGTERALAACEGAREAAACVRGELDALRQLYIAQLSDARAQKRANDLFAASMAAADLVAGMNRAEAQLRLREPSARLPIGRLDRRALLLYAPLAMCLVLAVWLFLSDRASAALLALIAGAASYLSLRGLKAPAGALPEATARALPDAAEMARRLERLVLELDGLLLADEERPLEAPLQLTRGLLEASQMLCEASLTKDGDFALRSVAQLTDALNGQGVELLMYAPEDRARFDVLPAKAGVQTIRPAMVKDGETILRGVAAIGRD